MLEWIGSKMNERIRELAVQAGYTPLPGFDFANDIQELFIKKFAELIVRECADTAFLEANSRKVQRAVLQHFGVEE